MRLHRRSLATDAKGPLNGVRVIDLSRVLVGNALTMQLGDYGAEVIKVEQPGAGDGLRAIVDGGVSVYWKFLSRNKKSIVVDLKQAKGVELILKLARTAHILIENFKPGTMEALGLSPDVLLTLNPKLVFVRASGWGATGPYRHKLGFGTIIEAFSGFAHKNGFPDSPPLLPNLGLGDLVCGLNGAFAAMIALREAEKEGGEGQVIDLSILDSMAALLGPDSGSYAATGQVPGRVGNSGAVAAPRNLYRTSDDHYLALSASTQTMADKLFAAIGRPEMSEDSRFATNHQRLHNYKLLDEIVQNFIGTRTLRENLDYFDSCEITVGPVNDIALFLADQHVIEREIVVEVPDPDMGWLPMPQPAVRLSKTPAAIRSPAPAMGEHTRSVLTDLGLSAEDISELLESGAVAGAIND